MKITSLWPALLIGVLGSHVAVAQTNASSTKETVTESKGYLSVMPFYFSPDTDRGTADDGAGLSIAYGRNFGNGWFWELQTFGDTLNTKIDPFENDRQYGLGVDAGYRFLHGDRATPYVLLGAGGVRNDVLGDAYDDTDVFGNVALGFMTGGLGDSGIRIRGEARYVRDDFRIGSVHGMNDWRIGLGVTIPIGRRVVEREVTHVVTKTETRTVPAEIVDTDGDGVPDQTDNCPRTLKGLATNSHGCVVKGTGQELELEGVTFELNSAKLTASAKAVLSGVVASLEGEPKLRAEISGYTDSSGNAAYNLDLSKKRANAVLTFLVNHGIKRSRLEAHGYGEARPVADNSTAQGRAQNRRVVFRVLN